MKNAIMSVVVAALLVMGIVGTRAAEAATLFGDYMAETGMEISVEAGMDYYNKYIWRGFRLDGDQVIQPYLTLSSGGFEGGFWGSFDAEQNDALASDEVDGWIGYSFDLGFIDPQWEKVGVSVGNTWYAFPSSDGSSTEAYVSLALDTVLSPYLSWYHDYGDESSGGADGNYLMLGIGHSVPLSEEYGISLDLGAEVGYNDQAFIAGEGGYYLATVGLTLPLTDGVSISPNLGYSIPYGDLDDASDGDQKNEFYGGVAIAFSL